MTDRMLSPITLEQEANLRIGAAYLRSLPSDYEGFYMKAFAMRGHQRLDPRQVKYECGTVACALGHFPAVIPALSREKYWPDYGLRVTGMGQYIIPWRWCFSGIWVGWDNTPVGAAERIEWFLDHGVPAGFSYDTHPTEDFVKMYKGYVSPVQVA